MRLRIIIPVLCISTFIVLLGWYLRPSKAVNPASIEPAQPGDIDLVWRSEKSQEPMAALPRLHRNHETNPMIAAERPSATPSLLSETIGSPKAAEAQAGPLDVTKYCEITVAKLELAYNVWNSEFRSPTDDEEQRLFEEYQITPKEYYSFSGANSKALASYLATEATLNSRIEELSTRIHEIIEQRDVR